VLGRGGREGRGAGGGQGVEGKRSFNTMFRKAGKRKKKGEVKVAQVDGLFQSNKTALSKGARGGFHEKGSRRDRGLF
jgi:hypothetical protein